ncbi:MAG TPA: hopanoid-associated sugar epimerase [Dehalococcoidia bacterium]|nr:hopanoid-associated sugar epimerase [Dehalococcoidia bacterium]
MKALVTGATGFVGGHVARELLRARVEVRALVRKPPPAGHPLGEMGVELAYGDLRDPYSLRKALRGCQALLHVAAHYAFWARDRREVYRTNVDGTRHLLSLALAMGIEKAVYTSTASIIAVPKWGLGTEGMGLAPDSLYGDYKRSKYMAEVEALKIARQGLPLVIVSPTAPVGWGDVRPTPTGQMILDFLRGRMPAYVDVGLNLIDVEDVAAGHRLALERGRPGERYILGHRNMTLKEMLDMLSTVAGRPAPRLRLPRWLVLAAAYLDEGVEGRLLRRPPRVPLAAARTAGRREIYDASKAVWELGLPQSPIEAALAKAVRWFREGPQAGAGWV